MDKLTIAQAAKLIGIKTKTLREACRLGRLNHEKSGIKTGRGEIYFVTMRDIDAWTEKSKKLKNLLKREIKTMSTTIDFGCPFLGNSDEILSNLNKLDKWVQRIGKKIGQNYPTRGYGLGLNYTNDGDCSHLNTVVQAILSAWDDDKPFHTALTHVLEELDS
jgi:hypothetical protein